MTAKFEQLEERRKNAAYCEELIAKYTNVTELTRQLAEDFIDTIIVGISDENGERDVAINLRV